MSSNKVVPESPAYQDDEKEEQIGIQESHQIKKALLSREQFKLLVGLGGVGLIALELYLCLFAISIFFSA